MSVKVMGIVWDHYPEGGGELLTALKLADHADHIGERIWPGVASLARQTRQSERTVQRHLQAMLDSGWLVRVEAGGKGPAHTTRYRMPIEAIPQGSVGRVTKLHPKQAPARVTPGAHKGDIHNKKGDTAMSPEPSLKAIVLEPKPSGPSPAAQCAEAYRHGIKTRYQADYPGSAKLNGIMAQLVKELGADPALAVVKAYMASSDKWYLTKRHALEYLKRDGAQIWVQLQERSGGAAKPPAAATTFLGYEGAKPESRMNDYPVDEPERIARKVLADYGKRILGWGAKYIIVQIGARRATFSIAELGR